MSAMPDDPLETRKFVEYLAGADGALHDYLEGLDPDGLARLCATALSVNGDRLRELAGVDAAEQMFQTPGRTRVAQYSPGTRKFQWMGHPERLVGSSMMAHRRD
jgi:hypothetical protein